MKQILRIGVGLCIYLAGINLADAQTQYLDIYFNVIPSADKAKYTRDVVIENDSTYLVMMKYISGETMMTGSYADSALLVPNGDFKYYYANGNNESEGRFKNGLKVGTWKRWSFDGVQKPDRYYPDENFKARTRATNPAKFPGGMAALQKLVADSLKYPEEAKSRGLEGTVYVAFTIDATGEVTHPEVSDGNHYLLNEEALRFVTSMPAWTPAYKDGIPVNSSFVLPVIFSVSNRSTQNLSPGGKSPSTHQ